VDTNKSVATVTVRWAAAPCCLVAGGTAPMHVGVHCPASQPTCAYLQTRCSLCCTALQQCHGTTGCVSC
jgi:hypothetical protein